MKIKKLLLPYLISLFIAMTARAQIISTAAGWNGSTGVSSFGNTGPANSGFPQFYNTPIFGQTFRVPTGADLLNSFGIYIAPRADFNTPTSPGVFKASVAAFDTNTLRIGPLLWTSGNTTLSSTAGFTNYNFTLNTALSATQTYVFFAEELSGAGSYMWGGSRADLYTDGSFVFSNTPGGSGAFTPFTSTVADAAFTAVFSSTNAITPVPEPSTYALFGALSCVSVAVVRRLRRAKSA